MFVLSMLIPFAMICSCQKQDSAAEGQLAQRKAELEAREKALDEREKALDERKRDESFAERKRAITNIQKTPAPVQGQTPDPSRQIPDPSQLKAEKERKMRELPAEVQALIPDHAKVKAETDKMIQDRLRQRQRRGESPRTQAQIEEAISAAKQSEKMKNDAVTAAPEAVYPSAQATSQPQFAPLSQYPQAEATSPSPTPTPQ